MNNNSLLSPLISPYFLHSSTPKLPKTKIVGEEVTLAFMPNILNESLDIKSNKIKINIWLEIILQLEINLDSYCTSNISLAYNLYVHGWILYIYTNN